MRHTWIGIGAAGIMAAVVITGGLGSTFYARAAGNDVVQQVGQGKVDWTSGIIRVTGGGAPPEKGSPAQKRLMAKRAAQADGYRQLAEVINGVHVDSETVVKDFVTQSDTIRTSVSALVKGALAVATRNLSDGSIEVDVEAKMYGPNGLLDAVDPWQNRKPGPPPTVQVQEQGLRTFPQAVQVASAGSLTGWPFLLAGGTPHHTGVILDVRGLGAEPAMSPTILDPGDGEIYIGQTPVDPDYVINVGVAGYYRTLEEAQKDRDRLGDNPLVLRPTVVTGRFRSNAKLSMEDAVTLLRADRQDNFLKGAKVVFVL